MFHAARPSSPVRQAGERRTTFLAKYALRRVTFFSFRITLLCAYHLLMQLSITLVARRVSSIDRPTQGVKTLKNYNDTCLINFIIGWS